MNSYLKIAAVVVPLTGALVGPTISAATPSTQTKIAQTHQGNLDRFRMNGNRHCINVGGILRCRHSYPHLKFHRIG